MNETGVVDLVRESMWIGGLIAGPILVTVLLVGLIAVMLLTLLIGGWQLQMLIDFARRVFERIPDVGL